jgi:hypothetical protein
LGISDHLESFGAKSFPADSKALARYLKRYRENKEFLATSGCIKIKTREREKAGCTANCKHKPACLIN